MFNELDEPESEPPLSLPTISPRSSSAQKICAAGARCSCSGDIMLTAAPPQAKTHAVIIGRQTLDSFLLLMKSGCASVASHSLDAPAVHLDQASLAWLEDLKTREDLDMAVQQASSCLCADGCMVLDASALEQQPTAVFTVLSCLAKVGFRLRSVLRQGSHLILVAARRPQLALAG